jgi:hypothetical protein
LEPLEALQQWYAQQCDGDWEHRYGIHIESCDNPGWWVKIDLVGTLLQTKSFTPIVSNVDANGHPEGPRWLHCHIADNQWQGAGDESQLPTIICHFLSWVAS